MKNSRIIGILLAAGSSKRMGQNKISLPLSNSTVGSYGLRKFINSKIDHVFVVTKEDDSLNWISKDLFQKPYKDSWSHVLCTSANKGQSYSLKCGLTRALKTKPLGIMILLADQPFLSIQTINKLHQNYLKRVSENSTIPFLAASFQGVPRPPIILSPNTIPDLFMLIGDEGARAIIRNHTNLEGLLVEFENKWDFFDIDTKEAYEVAKGVDFNL
ncbi:NTP transferase domain-containing protein [Bacillus sp. AFS053548]|uniref:NTP transferase domain-containing protein n=1 Tax=Bacillus sp. AFS053548 TaxID=2033505 RepID=UPI000BFC1B25|nr:NTP transferase domain-containing protein [Bacillus sp. AFS053548]PGM56054.1 xanthine dehydrogenase [Bacillus sp. AFS053548]